MKKFDLEYSSGWDAGCSEFGTVSNSELDLGNGGRISDWGRRRRENED